MHVFKWLKAKGTWLKETRKGTKKMIGVPELAV
jgi:hypothetical protein